MDLRTEAVAIPHRSTRTEAALIPTKSSTSVVANSKHSANWVLTYCLFLYFTSYMRRTVHGVSAVRRARSPTRHNPSEAIPPDGLSRGSHSHRTQRNRQILSTDSDNPPSITRYQAPALPLPMVSSESRFVPHAVIPPAEALSSTLTIDRGTSASICTVFDRLLEELRPESTQDIKRSDSGPRREPSPVVKSAGEPPLFEFRPLVLPKRSPPPAFPVRPPSPGFELSLAKTEKVAKPRGFVVDVIGLPETLDLDVEFARHSIPRLTERLRRVRRTGA